MADSEAPDCPLCLETLDETERNFKPCKCGYQLCLWCWQDIKEKLYGRCPACRSEYDPESFQFTAPDKSTLDKSRKKKQQTSKKEDKGPDKGPFEGGWMPKPGDNARVLQRNLLYVVGLSPSVAKEDILKRKDYFGKYGKIVKVAVNKKQSPACAYVTFKHDKDAAEAIAGMNGISVDGRVIRASYGTNKYCGAFLQGLPCTKSNCLYLHVVESSQHIVTKEELGFINAQTSNPNLVPQGPGSAPWYPTNIAGSSKSGGPSSAVHACGCMHVRVQAFARV